MSISVWITTAGVNGGRPRPFTGRDATPAHRRAPSQTAARRHQGQQADHDRHRRHVPLVVALWRARRPAADVGHGAPCPRRVASSVDPGSPLGVDLVQPGSQLESTSGHTCRDSPSDTSDEARCSVCDGPTSISPTQRAGSAAPRWRLPTTRRWRSRVGLFDRCDKALNLVWAQIATQPTTSQHSSTANDNTTARSRGRRSCR